MATRAGRNSTAKAAAKDSSSTASARSKSTKQSLSPSATDVPTNGSSAASKKTNSRTERLAVDKELEVKDALDFPASYTGAARKGTPKTKVTKAPLKFAKSGTKRKRADITYENEEEEHDDLLPHNMGKRPDEGLNIKKEVNGEIAISPKQAKAIKQEVEEEKKDDTKAIIKGAETTVEDGNSSNKKAKKAHPYGLMPGKTPFPDWPHPTVEEAQTVYDLLIGSFPNARHSRFAQPDTIPAPSEQVAGCGQVPTILDALIRTLLSAATSGFNSSNAFQGLVKRFGLETEGKGKGSVNWNKVHEAPREDVFEAIKAGGLADNKSKNIKKILALVHADNEERFKGLRKTKEAGEELTVEKEAEYIMLKKKALTLDYYHVLATNEALDTFSTFPGIGVKTAACVAMFCMQRPCFAVDTHVFRLCQYLGWVPPDETRAPRQKKADRNTTFSHCEVMIPNHLKYGLHQLFIEHGKHCPRCRAVTGENSAGWEDANCPIEHLVKRLGKKKGGVDTPKKRSAKKGKKANEEDEDDMSVSDGNVDTNPRSTRKATKGAGTTPSRPIKSSSKKNAAPVRKAQSRPTRKPVQREEIRESEMSEEDDVEMSDLTDASESAEESDDYDEED